MTNVPENPRSAKAVLEVVVYLPLIIDGINSAFFAEPPRP
jgi:hypothetical protein